MPNNKGNILLPLLAGVAIIAIAIAGYFFWQNQQLKENFAPQVNTSFIQTTNTPTPEPTSNEITTIPTRINKNIKQLNYSLPSDWKTFQSSSGKVEVGYNPLSMTASPGSSSNEVYIKNNLGVSHSVEIAPYDGGSRHLNLYNKIGINDEMLKADQWKLPEYHENEYSYNGWSCLVLVGVDISQYPQVWGVCPINSTQAIYLSASGLDDSSIEQFIQTIKVQK